MPHLVPQQALLAKAAALRAADSMGREQARELGVEKLAELAGAALSGSLSAEEWEFRKSAGIFSRIGGAIQQGISGIRRSWGASPQVSYGRGYLKTHPELAQKATQTVSKATQAVAKPGALAGVGRSLATFGKVAPWVAGAGLTYGLMKGVPWAAHQLEHSSSQTMAPSMGWSPVDYGYGSTPWGPGQASMGYGG